MLLLKGRNKQFGQAQRTNPHQNPESLNFKPKCNPFPSRVTNGEPTCSAEKHNTIWGAPRQLLAHVPCTAEVCDGVGPNRFYIGWTLWEEGSVPVV